MSVRVTVTFMVNGTDVPSEAVAALGIKELPSLDYSDVSLLGTTTLVSRMRDLRDKSQRPDIEDLGDM